MEQKTPQNGHNLRTVSCHSLSLRDGQFSSASLNDTSCSIRANSCARSLSTSSASLMASCTMAKSATWDSTSCAYKIDADLVTNGAMMLSSSGRTCGSINTSLKRFSIDPTVLMKSSLLVMMTSSSSSRSRWHLSLISLHMSCAERSAICSTYASTTSAFSSLSST